MANKGRTILNDTADLIAKINGGRGTLGKLASDDELYDNLQKASTQAQEAMTNLRQVSDEARRAIADGAQAQLLVARLLQQARLLQS